MANRRRKTITGIWINKNGKPVAQTKSYLISHADSNGKLVLIHKRKKW